METNELIRFRVISRNVIILKSAWSEVQFIDLSELTYTHIHLWMWPGVFLSNGNQLLVVRSSLVTQPLVFFEGGQDEQFADLSGVIFWCHYSAAIY